MKFGRPPNWNPVASLTASTWTEVVALTSKFRLQLPAAARARVSWSQSSGPLALLARIEPGGNAELLPWEPSGEAIMRGLARLLADEAERDSDQLALIAMDRYLKVTLEPDGRMSLPGNLVHHLDAIALDAVRVVIVGGRVFLWSEEIWQRARSARLESVLETLRGVEATAEDELAAQGR